MQRWSVLREVPCETVRCFGLSVAVFEKTLHALRHVDCSEFGSV